MSYKRGLRSAANAVAESEPKRLKKTTTVTTTDKDQQADAKSRSTEKSYWLFKAEPESRIVNGVDVKFSFDDLKTEHQATWDGVRNFEARNTMKKMNVGDLGFFYQSNCKIPGIVGILKVCKSAYPDSFDKKHPYYDPKSDPENPKWFMVDVEYVRPLKRLVSLQELKELVSKPHSPLNEMALLRRSRLSVTPVREKEWDFILQLAEEE
ncbi:PUA-like domain-containing protein [Kockiozyma suomiensis]|uniref:PUA-like domain-containing protein n=1 Tax=Kockiozyma suomiensis TaxID=1337062 RepID=UPI003343A390